MFQRILVPLDGSSLAEQALPLAAQLARASKGTIVLLNVVDISYVDASYGAMQGIVMPDVVGTCLDSASQYLDHISQRHDLNNIVVEKVIQQGYPAEMILSTIKNQAVDIVILSSHGYTGMKRWIMGSVAAKIVHHATVPVLLLREGKPFTIHQSTDGTTFVRALIPLDASARAQDAIAPTAALVAILSSPGQGALHLFQVVVPPKNANANEREQLMQAARQNLQAISTCIREGLVANYGPDLHLALTWSVDLDTDIATGIVQTAEYGEQRTEAASSEPCDLIAMTTHGYTGIPKWTMGSIAERVLHATKLPLLLVRPADMIEKETK